jgi:hypothetical protein
LKPKLSLANRSANWQKGLTETQPRIAKMTKELLALTLIAGLTALYAGHAVTKAMGQAVHDLHNKIEAGY